MILTDTNILIEIYRNNLEIINTVKKIGQENIAISDVTRAELLFGARNKTELRAIKDDFKRLTVLPIVERISAMAVNFIEQYGLSHKLAFPDALIASTAISHNLKLYTLNVKDFRFIKNLSLFES